MAELSIETARATLTAHATETVSVNFSQFGGRGHKFLHGVVVSNNSAGENLALKIIDVSEAEWVTVLSLSKVTEDYYAVRSPVYDSKGQYIPGVSQVFAGGARYRAEITGGTAGEMITIILRGSETHPDHSASGS